MKRLAVIFILVAMRCTTAHSDDELLRQIYSAWWDYEELRIVGQAWNIDTSDEKIPFVVNIGKASDGGLAPNEVGRIVVNPGEPHIGDARILLEANAEVDGLTLQFMRELVSREPAAARRSRMIMNSHPVSDLWTEIRRVVFVGVDGSRPQIAWKNVERIKQFTQVRLLGETDFLGHKCKRVQLTSRNRENSFPPVVFEFLAVFKPTMQILKFESVSGGPAAYADDALKICNFREVKSARIFDKWLLCDRAHWTAHDGSRWALEIEEASPLPKDYQGIWEYNRLTGVEFAGDAEPATRDGSPRILSRHSRRVSVIPFTAEEEQKIRDYLMAGVKVQPRRLNSFHVAMIAVNFVAVVLLVIYWKRRK